MKVDLINITEDAEEKIEEAGRTCYLSFDKKTKLPIYKMINEKSKKGKIFYSEDNKKLLDQEIENTITFDGEKWKIEKKWENSASKFINMLIKLEHLSVLEHAFATFRIKGGSRSFTHQLVRHRLASFSQQSQRYVDENRFNYIEPDKIKKNKEASKIFNNFMNQAKETYKRLRKLKIKKEDARFVLPNAVESEIVISANFREWRHILKLRGHPAAQWEIRKMCAKIAKILQKHAYSVFKDFKINEEKNLVTTQK